MTPKITKPDASAPWQPRWEREATRRRVLLAQLAGLEPVKRNGRTILDFKDVKR